jgi:lysophospholipase L1-like esterase
MRTLGVRLGTVASTALLLVACQAAGPVASSATSPAATASTTATATSAPASSPAGGSAWRLVALGDSDATGSGALPGKGWVDDYAALIRAGQGREVSVSNLAHNGMSSAQLASAVRIDQSLRAAIAAADIIVIGTGGADLNPGDDALAAGRCKGTSCYVKPIADFKTNFDAITAEISSLRAGKPTVLRAVTFPNGLTGAEDVIPPFLSSIATEVGVFQAIGLREAICTAMTSNGGQCIDVLTAFNGPGGDSDAYKTGLMNKVECCYPSEKGQSLMADLLYATGLAPLVGH